MEFSLNISNENYILNEGHQSLANDDVSYISKNHLPPDLTDISNRHQQNLTPLIPYQNQDSFNQNLVYNSPSYEIPSDYPFVSIETYSSTDNFEESMNSITNNNKIHMIYSTPISANPKGIFDNFQDLQGHTLWDETVHNKELTQKVYAPALDQMTGEPQSFDVPMLEAIKNTTRETMIQCKDQKMIKTYQKENKKVARTSKHSKKDNIIKAKWTESEDIKLKKRVELDGPKKWATIAKKLVGRTGKQCRERWHNHLRPDIKKADWSEEEDQILIEVHKVVGTKWIKIAQQLPGRSYNNIKNHWNTTKRRVQKQSSENSNPADNNILENYIRYAIINNDDISKTTETDGKTTNTVDDDDYKDMFVEEMSLSLDAHAQTNKPLVTASTTSSYVPMPETFTWENYTAELCEPMDDIQKLMHWWE